MAVVQEGMALSAKPRRRDPSRERAEAFAGYLFVFVPMALFLVGHEQPVDQITGQPARVDQGQVVLDPYQAVWLTAPGV